MKKNTSFVFVTHIMQEVMEFMDRVVVLRDGKLVGHYDMATDKVTEEDLTKVIIGKKSLGHAHEAESERVGNGEVVVLAVQKLVKSGSYYDISFDLHRGECIGIFGPAGSGKSELIKTIAGLQAYDSGSLLLKGKEAKTREPVYVRLVKGVGYFSGETGNELLHDWTITKNISILNISKVVMKFFRIIRFKAEKKMADRIVRKLRIKAPDVNTFVSTLSGGSKQKVTLGKWLERSPDILLLEDPTIGIDVGSREDIYETILDMKNKGISMILVSDDVKEYSTLCDRIMLVKQGRAQKFISAEQLKEVMEI